MIKSRSLINFLCIACLLVMLIFALSIGAPALCYADRATVSGSDVLADLVKDGIFEPATYPYRENDHSLTLIHIAESSDKELLVYVYQPGGKEDNLRASSINISTSLNSLSYKNYKLNYLNSNGVFFKYSVKDFVVSDNETRYYSITSIYREWQKEFDTELTYENYVAEVSYSVAKEYRYEGEDSKYHCDVSDVVTITDKFVGFVRYFDGYGFGGSVDCDSHFVAFNTDCEIDTLIEADVYYVAQRYNVNTNGIFDWLIPGHTTFYEKTSNYAYLSDEDHVDHKGPGWGPVSSYAWDRIETVDQFLEENIKKQNVYESGLFDVVVASSVKDEALERLKGKKWVLRFAETSHTFSSLSNTNTDEYGTLIGEVSILRLKFKTGDKVYNLGVVDNKQSGSNSPTNGSTTELEAVFNLFDLLEEKTGIPRWVWIMIAIAIPLAILLPVLSAFFPAFRAVLTTVLKGTITAIVWLLKGLVWLICLPFRGIKALIENIKNR